VERALRSTGDSLSGCGRLDLDDVDSSRASESASASCNKQRTVPFGEPPLRALSPGGDGRPALAIERWVRLLFCWARAHGSILRQALHRLHHTWPPAGAPYIGPHCLRPSAAHAPARRAVPTFGWCRLLCTRRGRHAALQHRTVARCGRARSCPPGADQLTHFNDFATSGHGLRPAVSDIVNNVHIHPEPLPSSIKRLGHMFVRADQHERDTSPNRATCPNVAATRLRRLSVAGMDYDLG